MSYYFNVKVLLFWSLIICVKSSDDSLEVGQVNYFVDGVFGRSSCSRICEDAQRWGTEEDCERNCPNWPFSTTAAPPKTTTPTDTVTQDKRVETKPISADNSRNKTMKILIFSSVSFLLVLIVAVVGYVVYHWKVKASRKNIERNDPEEVVVLQPTEPAEEMVLAPFEERAASTLSSSSSKSSEIWPASEAFFNNFPVGQSYRIRSQSSGESQLGGQQNQDAVHTPIAGHEEPSESDNLMAEMPFAETNTIVDCYEQHDKYLVERKRSALEAIRRHHYLDNMELSYPRVYIIFKRGGPTVDEIRQDLLNAGFSLEHLTIEYSRSCNFEMAFEHGLNKNNCN